MPSDEYLAFVAAAAARPVPPPPADMAEQRSRIDAAMSQIPLADGIEAVPFVRGGVPGTECRPVGGGDDLPILLWFHGGGFRIASSLAYRSFSSHLSVAFGARVLMPDYRLAPEYRFPAAVDDCWAVWESLLAEGFDASRVVIGGDSAGGGLAASVTLHALADGVLPAGTICLSPWVDLTVSSATYDSRSDVDKMFSRDSAAEAVAAYLAAHDPRDPMASPVFGDWHGAPPLQIICGDAEVLLDDAHLLHDTAQDAGVDVTISVYPDMPHIFPFNHPAFPEATQGLHEMASFFHRVVG